MRARVFSGDCDSGVGVPENYCWLQFIGGGAFNFESWLEELTEVVAGKRLQR